MKYIWHQAGSLVDGVQRCMVCGEVLADYRHTMSPDPTWKPAGFAMGDVYVSVNNRPRITTSEIGKGDEFKMCNS